MFYLHHEDAELANEAFYKAQTLDPDYALAWVGQGLVATANNHNREASALFEHATGLTAAAVRFIMSPFETSRVLTSMHSPKPISNTPNASSTR